MATVPQPDRLYVLNLALMKVPLPPLASLTDMDWNANQVFEHCAAQVFQECPWNFAQTFTTLTRSSRPDGAYKYAYDLPDDCLKVISIRQHESLLAPQASFSVAAGRQLLCNISPCHLQYVQFLDSPEDWNPDFTDAVACRIACELAPLASQDSGVVSRMKQLYALALSTAQQHDAVECRERVPLNPSIYLMSGRGLGGRRNKD